VKNVWEHREIKRFIYDVLEDDWGLTEVGDLEALEDQITEVENYQI